MSISILLEMAAEAFGDRIVLGRRSDGYTAGQLRSLALGGASVVRDCGADSLVLLAANGVGFPVGLFAAAAAGVAFVPLNYRLGQAQLVEVLGGHPGALGIADPEHRDILSSSGLTAYSIAEWVQRCASDAPHDGGGAETESTAVVIYTSGSTSTPKGVRLSHENLVSYVLGSVEFMSAAEDEAALVSVPPYHIAGVANVLTNLYAGRRVVSMESFTAQSWLDTVRTEGITQALVVPTMLARLMDCPTAELDAPSLRTLSYGGAPMPTSVIERAMQIWPHVDFVNAYGLTETSSTIALLGPKEHRAAVSDPDPEVRRRLSSVGLVLPGIELEIRDADGDAVEQGKVGRIWVRGPQVSGRYGTAAPSLDARGFFDTRDEGHLDGGGYLFLSGRADDTIIRGGENIAPAEIEDVLLGHPSVLDAAVVGMPDDHWGQRIEAAVVLRAGEIEDSEALRAYVRGRLRSSKTPDRIVYVPNLPRNDLGKLVRRHVISHMGESDYAR